MKKLFTIAIVLTCISLTALAQEQKEMPHPETIDEVRTQSGVDPTRITSRFGFSTTFFDRPADNALIRNRLSATFGVDNWSFQLKAESMSANTIPGEGFRTGFGDLKFAVLNSFYTKGRHALAGSLDVVLPTASRSIAQAAGMGSHMLMTAAVTYAFTVTPSFFVAAEPQYTFTLAKSKGLPDANIFTVRLFMAYFFKSGFFMVLEPRPIYDITNKQFSMYLSPIVGKTLGGGFNLIAMAEIPLNKSTMQKAGATYIIGFNRVF